MLLSLAALAILSAPVLLDGTGVPYISGIDAIAGNGKGKGGGNSGGGGNSSQSKGKSSSASAAGNGTAKGKKSAGEAVVVEAAVKSPGSKRSLNAELGRLNSLKRNINGLMNSNDPKMAGIRAYVIANGTLVDAQETLAVASADLTTAQSAYIALVTSLGVGGYPNLTPAGLQGELDAVNAALAAAPEDATLLDQQAALTSAIATINASPELAALLTASENIVVAEDGVFEAEQAVSEDVLREALLLAANPNRRSEDYLTPEIMAWASNELGVGDANGLIDEYLARR